MGKQLLTCSEKIAEALKRHGVECFFAQSNPVGLSYACEKAGIRAIGFRTENTGSYMAQGYGICSGKVPVLFSQNGPAATLIVSGLAECLRSSYPVVALVQDIHTQYEEKNAFQELDHVAMFKPVSKWVKRINLKERIDDFIDMAFVQAASGRPGPAVLLIPSEMLYDLNKYEFESKRTSTLGTYPADRTLADPSKIEEAAKLLAAAERPLIYAGGGVVSSGASEILRKIQSEFALPVATSSMGKGSVDEDDPLTLGPIGYYMGRRGQTKFMRSMVTDADLIFLIGNRTNQNGTDAWTLLPDTKYIHLDVDPTEIGRNYEALRLVGDAKLSLEALYEALKKQDLSKREAKRAEVVDFIKKGKEAHAAEIKPACESDDMPIRVERVLYEVEKRLDDNHVVVADASFASIWIANYIKATGTRKFVLPRGIAGIGWGLPMAIGAKVARPNCKTFCLAGDGGFGHAWSDLETCVRENADVVLVVMNNQVLGYQKLLEDKVFGGTAKVCNELGPVDHAKIAEACGATGIRVEKVEDLPAAMDKAFSIKGTVVVDVLTNKTSAPPVPMFECFDTVKYDK